MSWAGAIAAPRLEPFGGRAIYLPSHAPFRTLHGMRAFSVPQRRTNRRRISPFLPPIFFGYLSVSKALVNPSSETGMPIPSSTVGKMISSALWPDFNFVTTSS